MKFKKITDSCRPAFRKTVLLLETKDDKAFVSTGFLSSINENGFQFKIQDEPADDLFGFFKNKISNFKPTHWCEIVIEFEKEI